MRISQCIGCADLPCQDVKQSCYVVPDIDIDPKNVTIVLISEAAPADSEDYYYAPGKPLFEETTVLAFNDAGVEVSSVNDILDMGVYMTTAVKCGKVGYGLKAAAIKECSKILEKELNLFPNTQVLLLMGDVAIKAINYIAKRKGYERVIPAGSTYKIRGKSYSYGSVRAFPSYVQAGPSFFIEKSKRRMISEDIKAALQV
ncbi:MAG: uracil-DNA glycosylase family protein [Anaerolineae bacterium]|nr:MAG: uracil-DNA glycosylase family protein [Anaerolineae bacterium]